MNNNQILDAQKELLSHRYGHAMAYTNVILLAGYAGFFAIWSFLKPELTKGQIFLSALLISVSLAVFIFWEVYQSFFHSRDMLDLAKAVEDPALFVERIEAYKRVAHNRNITFSRVWHIIFYFTVATGLSGVLVLLFAIVQSLWRSYLVR